MITLLELLEDPVYKKFFQTKPRVPKVASALSPPWVVYVQLEAHGPWRRKRFDTYAQAYNWLRPRIKRFHDASITCPKVSYKGPHRMVRIKGKYVVGSDGVKRQATKRVAWKPKLPLGEDDDHRWCKYCRRPTVFRWFSRHHALGKLESGEKHCVICGASERLMGRTLYPVENR